jgi:hypothetical protein
VARARGVGLVAERGVPTGGDPGRRGDRPATNVAARCVADELGLPRRCGHGAHAPHGAARRRRRPIR